jgi:hypothetical protein
MRFSVAVNVLLGVVTIVSAFPISKSTSSLELESRGSFIATFKLTLIVLTEILDDVEASDMFERGYDDPATVDMCKLEPYPQFRLIC